MKEGSRHMTLMDRFKNYLNKRQMSKEERRRLEDLEQLEEYNAREERYNDMVKNEMQRQKFLNKMNTLRKTTYTKKMVGLILGICIIDIQLTYILAFFDKGQIVDTLSNNLCMTILGVSFIYMIRAYFDSKAEHNNIDNKIKEEIKNSITSKINNAFQANGLDIDVNDLLVESDNQDKTSKGFHININAGSGTPTDE